MLCYVLTHVVNDEVFLYPCIGITPWLAGLGIHIVLVGALTEHFDHQQWHTYLGKGQLLPAAWMWIWLRVNEHIGQHGVEGIARTAESCERDLRKHMPGCLVSTGCHPQAIARCIYDMLMIFGAHNALLGVIWWPEYRVYDHGVSSSFSHAASWRGWVYRSYRNRTTEWKS